MTSPVRISGDGIDLSGRIAIDTSVDASPADATETVIATISAPSHLRTDESILLEGWAAFTVGTNGASVRLRIRRTSVAGTVKADTGAVTGGVTAAGLVTLAVAGVDTSGTDTYVLTLTVGSATAASTVSAVLLKGTIYN